MNNSTPPSAPDHEHHLVVVAILPGLGRALATLRRVVQLHALFFPVVDVDGNCVHGALVEALRAVGGPYKDPITVPQMLSSTQHQPIP